MEATHRLNKIFTYATKRSVVHTALMTSAVVGSVLNAINQFPNLLTHTPLSPLKIALNYLTPYVVATTGAVRMCFQFEGERQKGSEHSPCSIAHGVSPHSDEED